MIKVMHLLFESKLFESKLFESKLFEYKLDLNNKN